MQIKNNSQLVNAIGAELLDQSGSFNEGSVDYAQESTIAAVSKSKTEYEDLKDAVLTCQNQLTEDTGRMKTVSDAFEEADMKISQAMDLNKK